LVGNDDVTGAETVGCAKPLFSTGLKENPSWGTIPTGCGSIDDGNAGDWYQDCTFKGK
jgi:hypothetical protein